MLPPYCGTPKLPMALSCLPRSDVGDVTIRLFFSTTNRASTTITAAAASATATTSGSGSPAGPRIAPTAAQRSLPFARWLLRRRREGLDRRRSEAAAVEKDGSGLFSLSLARVVFAWNASYLDRVLATVSLTRWARVPVYEGKSCGPGAWRARMRGGSRQQWARRLTRGLGYLGPPVSVGDCPARSA